MPISAALGSSALLPAGLGFRNKLINGDMRIAQRGTGSITAASQNQYPVDRWTANSNATNSITFQQVADAPAGFTYSVKATSGGTGAAYSSNHYTFFTQKIEGFNIADLAWGTSSAKPITISFWVKVSANAVGTHAIAVENSAGTMNYVATYTVNSTNWEYKTIQIYGPTSGTFNVDNTLGINLNFTLGAGSTYDATAGVWTSGKYSVSGAVDLGALSSATWQITGVQLEQNTQPTPFEQRLYGVELGLCQRYYYKFGFGSSYSSLGNAAAVTTTYLMLPVQVPVAMRLAGSMTLEKSGTWTGNSTGWGLPAANWALDQNATTQQTPTVYYYQAQGFAANAGSYHIIASNNSLAYMAFNAELN